MVFPLTLWMAHLPEWLLSLELHQTLAFCFSHRDPLPFHMCFQWLNIGRDSASSQRGIGLLTPLDKLFDPRTFVLLFEFLIGNKKI